VTLPVPRYLDELVLHATAFAEAVRAAGHDTTVASCPDWTVRDLAEHVGAVHRWCAGTLRAGDVKLQRRGATDPPMPVSEDEVSTWLLEGAALVSEAVREVGEDATVGGFGGPVPARFWARRQCHETLVHRGDAELAARLPPWSGVAPEVAADAVDEYLELVVMGAKRRPELKGEGQTLHLHATDPGLGEAGEWVLTLSSDGPVLEHGHRKADVAARGPAVALLGVVMNRQDPEDAGVDVLGAGELLAHWREHAAF
jgi:uncharacterized protein (TIGR03083 family)